MHEAQTWLELVSFHYWSLWFLVFIIGNVRAFWSAIAHAASTND